MRKWNRPLELAKKKVDWRALSSTDLVNRIVVTRFLAVWDRQLETGLIEKIMCNLLHGVNEQSMYALQLSHRRSW